MTSKLIDKLTKFCFHSASPPTPLRLERGVITEINLSLGITKPNSISFTAKFCLYFTPSLYLSLCHSVFKKIIYLHLSLCHSVFKNPPFFVCPSVILSLKHPLSPFCHYVILSLKTLCHYMSLCHFVSKKNSVITRPYAILSLKHPLSPSVPMLFCL